MCVAEKVTENLAQLTSQVTPGDVSSVYGIRKAMGISLPSEPAEGTFTHLTTGTVPNTQAIFKITLLIQCNTFIMYDAISRSVIII